MIRTFGKCDDIVRVMYMLNTTLICINLMHIYILNDTIWHERPRERVLIVEFAIDLCYTTLYIFNICSSLLQRTVSCLQGVSYEKIRFVSIINIKKVNWQDSRRNVCSGTWWRLEGTEKGANTLCRIFM